MLATRELVAPLDKLLRSLEPLTSIEPRRFLFIATKTAPWTAFLDNSWNGTRTDPIGHIAKSLECLAIRLVAVPDTVRKDPDGTGKLIGRYGATMFQLWGPNDAEFSNCQRSVSAMNDGGGWKFAQVGEPLPGEDVARYSAKRTRERFTPEDLDRLCRTAFSLQPFEDDFYEPRAFLVERTGPHAAGMEEMSIEAARARLDAPA